MGGRAGLTAVSQGPSSIADKHVCLSIACAHLGVCLHVCACDGNTVREIKPHDMGIPAVRPGTVLLPHTSTNASLLNISVSRLPSGSAV